MSLTGSLSWRWRTDPSPPEPRAAVAWHGDARILHARLEQLPEEVQKRLYATASRDVLVVTGAPEDLPWTPGIAYAAACSDAPTLWRPTLLRPDAPEDLLCRALQQLHAAGQAALAHPCASLHSGSCPSDARMLRAHGCAGAARQPLLLWPDPEAVIPLHRLLSVTPQLLARIAEQWRAL